MTASSLEDAGKPAATVPFLVESILLNMEGGRYVGLLVPVTFSELVSGICGGGGGINGGGGCRGGSRNGSGSGYNVSRGVGSVGGYGGRVRGAGCGGAGAGTGGDVGAAMVRVRYEAHLPDLSL